MWRREGPTSRQNPMEPSLPPPVRDLARSLFGSAPGVSVPALKGLSSKRRYASCKSLVSPGSCSDFGRDLILLRWASARSMMARAAGKDDDAYSITGARTAEG